MQVSLVPLERIGRRAESAPTASGTRKRASTRATPDLVEPRFSNHLGSRSREDDGPLQDAQSALRRLRDCAAADLTREERQDCETKKWSAEASYNPRLNADPGGRFVSNPEPYLSRRPTDGCRARLTGAVDPMGDSGNARGGVTCVKPF